ncbi:MAG: endonuclease III [Succinivibrionaceae bacterium]
MNKKTISEIFEIFSKDNPNPKSELKFSNNFELLCAVVLSAQTTDAQVNKVTPSLFYEAPNPYKMVELGIERIQLLISSIGLNKAKSKYLYELSKDLIDKYSGCVPNDEAELVTLPGVGIKTARVVQNIAFNKNTIAVDTHIFRVATRIGLSNAKTPNKMSDFLEKIIPIQYLHNAHHYLILHGRYICKARNPKCEECKISNYCKYFKTHKNTSI